MIQDYIVEVANMSCFAGKEALVSNINWKIRYGEKWVVFGHNGCGKTTLLSIIAGYKDYSHGSVKVFGEMYREENILKMRKKIGWISSSFFDKCYYKEKVLDIVLAGVTKTLGVSDTITPADYRRAQELLAELGIKNKGHASFDMLSKGERQNVLLAREFMIQPELLILDEPGTGLDVMSREYLLATINKLSTERNITIIYVTHYPEEILPIFTQGLLLRNGAVYKIDSTENLFQSEIMSDYWEYPANVFYSDNNRPNFVVEAKTFNKLLK